MERRIRSACPDRNYPAALQHTRAALKPAAPHVNLRQLLPN